MARRAKSRVGRRSRISEPMRKFLRDALIIEPDLYRDEMADLLHEEFGGKVSERSISRALRAIDWSRKRMHRIAQQRDPDLRAKYQYDIAEYPSEYLVFIDESGCDRRIGYRHWGWSLRGTAPLKATKFGRGKRWHILPAYTQDGILLKRIYQGSTDAACFNDFILELLQYCGRYPGPRSVLVMDNASWHHSEEIREICDNAGVKLLYLPPYSPDFNPIEEFFSVLKSFIRRYWRQNQDIIAMDFKKYLGWCVDKVGSHSCIAEAHFRHAGHRIRRTKSKIWRP
jgi:transposase